MLYADYSPGSFVLLFAFLPGHVFWRIEDRAFMLDIIVHDL